MAETLTEKEKAVLTAAILTAVSQEDEETAKKLAKLARSPEEFRAVMQAVPSPDESPDDRPETESAPEAKSGRIGGSPFRGRKSLDFSQRDRKRP